MKLELFGGSLRRARGATRSAGHQFVVVMAVNVLVMALNVVIGLAVARHFNAEAYGYLAYFTSVFGGLRLIAALGINSQAVIDLARARGQGRPVEQHFYPLLGARIITSTALALVAAGIGWATRDTVLIIAALAASIALIDDFGAAALRGLGLVSSVVIVQSVQPLVYAIGAAVVVQLGLAVEALFTVFLLSFLVSMLLAVVWLAPHLKRVPTSGVQLKRVWTALWSAGGLYIMAIGGTIYTSYATLYLGWLDRFAEAAYLAIPLYVALMPATIAGSAVSTVYFPRLVELHAKRDRAAAQRLIADFVGYVAAATLLITVTLLLFPHVVLYLLYGPRYQESAALLRYVAPVTFLYTIHMVLSFTATAQDHIRRAIVGTFALTLTLLIGITLGTFQSQVLPWFAASYGVAALVGFSWQWIALGPMLQEQAKVMLRQGAVAGMLVGSVRLVIADTPAHIPLVVAFLAVATLVFGYWIWITTGRARIGMPVQG